MTVQTKVILGGLAIFFVAANMAIVNTWVAIIIAAVVYISLWVFHTILVPVFWSFVIAGGVTAAVYLLYRWRRRRYQRYERDEEPRRYRGWRH
jgi:membrane protein implicated in regulation of membrane protease activity